MNAMPSRPRRTQRGVALITAMIIFALAMILAADVVRRSYLDQRLSLIHI